MNELIMREKCLCIEWMQNQEAKILKRTLICISDKCWIEHVDGMDGYDNVGIYAEYNDLFVMLSRIMVKDIRSLLESKIANRTIICYCSISKDLLSALRNGLWPSNTILKAFELCGQPEYLNEFSHFRNEEMKRRKCEQEERERVEKERLQREETNRRENEIKALAEAERKFLNKEYIDNDEFLLLLKKNNIKVHLRTLHNIQQSLVDINSECLYRYRKMYRKNSTRIYHPSMEGVCSALYLLNKVYGI